MKVARAHRSADVEAVRASLARLPEGWGAAVAHLPWHIYPPDLSPLWTGLVPNDYGALDGGFPLHDAGGWYSRAYDARDNRAGPQWVRPQDRPHLYARSYDDPSWMMRTAAHEAAHALADLWALPVARFFKPGAAMRPYAATNADEYFACAVEAFVVAQDHPKIWTRHDLARRDPKLHAYLTHLASA